MGRLTDWFRRKGGRTVRVPAKGRALILSDLHGHYGDWKAFCGASSVLERMRDGEDLYLLLTGDVPDVTRHRAVDPHVPEDGDIRILEDLMALQQDLGEGGKRVIYLEGNHDFHVSRICREVARWHAFRDGTPPAKPTDHPQVSAEQLEAYFDYYRESYGDSVFANNIGPYDMVRRVRPDVLEFLESGPILAVLEGPGVLVTHAGPARRASWKPKALRRSIDHSDRNLLREITPQEYYETPYHQLLNNRFRNNDYSLKDLSSFLKLYEANLLVTGHTPHPYLIDFDLRAPLTNCFFQDGLGIIGGEQIVLCSSFGALHPTWKTYLELDLSRAYPNVETLFEDEAVRPLYTAEQCAHLEDTAMPGAEIIMGTKTP